MAVDVAVVKTHWGGTSGGPGITQMHFAAATDPHTWDAAAAQTIVNAVRSFWNTYQAGLPDNISLTVDPVVDVFNIINGGLVGTATAGTAPLVVNGTDAGQFNMAAGIKLGLKTGSILNRRRVHGGIFIVPASGQCFDTNGTITATANGQFLGAANTLLSASVAANAGLVVWSRPRPASTTYNRHTGVSHAVAARDGAVSPVTGFVINSHGAMLRGRRD